MVRKMISEYNSQLYKKLRQKISLFVEIVKFIFSALLCVFQLDFIRSYIYYTSIWIIHRATQAYSSIFSIIDLDCWNWLVKALCISKISYLGYSHSLYYTKDFVIFFENVLEVFFNLCLTNIFFFLAYISYRDGF